MATAVIEQRNSLVEDNIGLVRKAVQIFVGRGIEAEDLFQIGCLGLLRAAEKFDKSMGYQFSTYAFPTILGEIKSALRSNDSIRVSRGIKALAARALQEREKLENNLGRSVSVTELALSLECDFEELSMALSTVLAVTSPISIDADDGGENGSESGSGQLLNTIASNESENDWVDMIDFKARLTQLCGRERALFELRFIRGMNQHETASQLGISQAQVSRLERCVLLKVKSGGCPANALLMQRLCPPDAQCADD